MAQIDKNIFFCLSNQYIFFALALSDFHLLSQTFPTRHFWYFPACDSRGGGDGDLSAGRREPDRRGEKQGERQPSASAQIIVTLEAT